MGRTDGGMCNRPVPLSRIEAFPPYTRPRQEMVAVAWFTMIKTVPKSPNGRKVSRGISGMIIPSHGMGK
jgi:hypothetical protein